jgi:hypothetical protein
VNIEWGQFTRADGTTHRQIEVSASSDGALFDALATELPVALGGRWSARLDGLDQRYWDLRCGSGKITLHLEHYLGISIYPTDGTDATPASVAMLDQAFDFLSSYDPPSKATQTDAAWRRWSPRR